MHKNRIMSVFCIGISLSLILYCLIYLKHKKTCKLFPPGPPSVPILGSIPFLDKRQGYAAACANENLYHYDPKLCTVWLGLRPIIVIQNFALAKDLLARDEFAGRPQGYTQKHVRGRDGETLGILFTTGKFWQEQRRFTLKHLKNLGFGRNKLDTIIHEEVSYLINDMLYKSKYGDVLIEDTFNFLVINILWQIVASRKYDPNLKESKAMMKKISVVFKEGPTILDVFTQSPFIRSLIPVELEKAKKELKEMFRQQILEHENELELDGVH